MYCLFVYLFIKYIVYFLVESHAHTLTPTIACEVASMQSISLSQHARWLLVNLTNIILRMSSVVKKKPLKSHMKTNWTKLAPPTGNATPLPFLDMRSCLYLRPGVNLLKPRMHWLYICEGFAKKIPNRHFVLRLWTQLGVVIRSKQPLQVQKDSHSQEEHSRICSQEDGTWPVHETILCEQQYLLFAHLHCLTLKPQTRRTWGILAQRHVSI